MNPLINTKWEYKVVDGCISYIIFKTDCTYEDYNCERDYPFNGKYKLKQDTIYLTEIDLLSDLSEEKREVIKGRSKYLYKEEYIEYISWEAYENKKWSEPIKPPQKIYYKKVLK
jgi:hypothetical protein